MSPKFGRKQIEVAKSFISSSKTSLSEEFTFSSGQNLPQFSKSFSGSPEVASNGKRRSSSSNILEEKSTQPPKENSKSEMEKAKSKIEKLFSPKLKNRKSMSPLKSRSVSPTTSADVKNPQFLESSIIDEEIEEDSEIRMIVDEESGVSKIGTIELKKGSKTNQSAGLKIDNQLASSLEGETKIQTRPSSLLLDKNRNPSLSSRVSIIDLVN